MESTSCTAAALGSHLTAHFNGDENKNYALGMTAREPKGRSEIPKETFADIFKRMESMGPMKLEWEAVKQFFTNRGLPQNLLAQETQSIRTGKSQQRPEVKEFLESFPKFPREDGTGKYNITVPKPFKFDKVK